MDRGWRGGVQVESPRGRRAPPRRVTRSRFARTVRARRSGPRSRSRGGDRLDGAAAPRTADFAMLPLSGERDSASRASGARSWSRVTTALDLDSPFDGGARRWPAGVVGVSRAPALW